MGHPEVCGLPPIEQKRSMDGAQSAETGLGYLLDFGVESFGFEGGAVAGDDQPMADFFLEEIDGAKGKKLAAESGIFGVD